MTIRTPARFLRCAYRADENTARDLPAARYAGPAMVKTGSRAMADALAKVTCTFGPADHLATVQLPCGQWAAVTTC